MKNVTNICKQLHDFVFVFHSRVETLGDISEYSEIEFPKAGDYGQFGHRTFMFKISSKTINVLWKYYLQSNHDNCYDILSAYTIFLWSKKP